MEVCGDQGAYSKVKVNRVMMKTDAQIVGGFLNKEKISIVKRLHCWVISP